MAMRYILEAAKTGQTLPILTIFLLIQIVAHVGVHFSIPSEHPSFMRNLSFALILGNFTTVMIGYGILIALYRHSVRCIFNREIPPTIKRCLPSFGAHLALLRPLEIVFRYFTHSSRALPDIIVLGEVRCGTTTLCQYLSSLQDYSFDCQTPFCLWAHPELDHKETFFFVGHYLGRVTPSLYRMCFPLDVSRFPGSIFRNLQSLFCSKGAASRPFLTFDGCAQYLTSPTAPYLIAEAYRAAGQPPPILIACVRDPNDQARSWWKYENNAMVWGNGMGLDKYNTKLRSDAYPLSTINDALQFSCGEFVNHLYQKAENLFPSSLLSHATMENQKIVLPDWAMSWPGGQLSGIGRNAKFVENISRYEAVFDSVFGLSNDEGRLEYTNILPLKSLSDKDKLKEFLVDVLEKVANRRRKLYEKKEFLETIEVFKSSKNDLSSIHRNASRPGGKVKEPMSSDEIMSEQTMKYFDTAGKELIEFLSSLE